MRASTNYLNVEMHINGELSTNDCQMKLREAFADPKLGSVHRGVGLEIGVGVTYLLKNSRKIETYLEFYIATQFAYCDRIYIASNTYTIQRALLRRFC